MTGAGALPFQRIPSLKMSKILSYICNKWICLPAKLISKENSDLWIFTLYLWPTLIFSALALRIC